MKHISALTRGYAAPRKAESLLVMQQKVALFAALSAAWGVLGESIGTWLDLRNND